MFFKGLNAWAVKSDVVKFYLWQGYGIDMRDDPEKSAATKTDVEEMCKEFGKKDIIKIGSSALLIKFGVFMAKKIASDQRTSLPEKHSAIQVAQRLLNYNSSDRSLERDYKGTDIPTAKYAIGEAELELKSLRDMYGYEIKRRQSGCIVEYY